MAKFALPMKDGIAVSRMAELREHFDLKEAIKYLGNGRLMKWLRDRGYDDEADKLDALLEEGKGNHSELAKRLCAILGVELDETIIDPGKLEGLTELSRKAERLGQYTSDTAILATADRAAFDQADLDKLVRDGNPDIYLCNGTFTIPLARQGRHYYGFGNAVAVIPHDEYVDFEALRITFDEVHKVKFDEKYEQILEAHKRLEEQRQESRKKAEQADAYFQQAKTAGEGEAALENFRKAANLGHIKAMMQVGNYYYFGDVVPRDYGEALRWFQCAAKKNEPRAMFRLGVIFHDGQGVEKNYETAFYWFKAATDVSRGKMNCEDVCRASLWYLGTMYRSGNGTDKDEIEAFQCLRESAELGDSDAMVEVGIMYENGEGVYADRLAARKWYTQAMEAENASGAFQLGYWNEKYEEDFEKAAQYYKKAVRGNDDDAMLRLGILYQEGKVAESGDSAQTLVEKAAKLGNAEAMVLMGRWTSGKESRRWFRKAAEEGNTEAMLCLGLSYEGQDDNPQNFEEAAKWYRKAADGGNTDAMNLLGLLYADGNGVEQDMMRARKLFLDAASAGNAAAMTSLGVMCQGENVDKADSEEAIKWFEKAAAAGDAKGMEYLGNYYLDKGVYYEAENWYEKSAKGGNEDAARRLSEMYKNGIGVAKDKEMAEVWEKKAEKLSKAENKEGFSTTTKVLAGVAAVGALAFAPVTASVLGIGGALYHFFGPKDKK